MATYKVRFYDRGSKVPLFAIEALESLNFERKRGEQTVANIKLPIPTYSTPIPNYKNRILDTVRPARTQLAIFRNDLCVWVGVVTLIQIDNEVSITARDVTWWLSKIPISQGIDHSREIQQDTRFTTSIDFVPDFIEKFINNYNLWNSELAKKTGTDIPNIDIDIITKREFPKGDYKNPTQNSIKFGSFSMTCYDLIEKFHTDYLISYTAINNTIIFFETQYDKMGYLPPLTANDIDGYLRLTRSGQIMFNVLGSNLSGGNWQLGKPSVYATAPFNWKYTSPYDREVGGPDWESHPEKYNVVKDYLKYYGVIAGVENNSNADNPPDKVTDKSVKKRVDTLNGMISKSYAPLTISVPANSKLKDEAIRKIGFERLIPGALVTLRAKIYGETVSSIMRLETVTVSVEEGNKENISITLGDKPSKMV